MEDNIRILNEWIEDCENIVFFGGAGVSTESGIPDFRSVDGLYNQKYKYPPETIISRSFFDAMPDEFYRFYRDKLIVNGAEPNEAHKYLTELEREGRLKAVITQNIDGLHQKAGSNNVLELHGSLLRNYCVSCGKRYGADYVQNASEIPRCRCGGIVRPDIVLYEEQLDSGVLRDSIDAIRHADMLIVGGTSLVVYPAAGLVDYYRGNRLVVINLSPTHVDTGADLLITGKIGEVFGSLRRYRMENK